jgi:hypothetical protein
MQTRGLSATLSIEQAASRFGGVLASKTLRQATQYVCVHIWQANGAYRIPVIDALIERGSRLG